VREARLMNSAGRRSFVAFKGIVVFVGDCQVVRFSTSHTRPVRKPLRIFLRFVEGISVRTVYHPPSTP